MFTVNRQRRRSEEAQRRRAMRERASYLESNRRGFVEFMRRSGVPTEQQELELRKLDDVVRFYENAAERGDVDP